MEFRRNRVGLAAESKRRGRGEEKELDNGNDGTEAEKHARRARRVEPDSLSLFSLSLLCR